MFFVSFVAGEDPFYLIADTDDVTEANAAWYHHVMESEHFTEFRSCTLEDLDEPVLLDGESNVWHVGLYRSESEGRGDELLLGFAFGPLRIEAATLEASRLKAHFKECAARGNRESYDAALASVPDTEPDASDRL